MKKLFLFLTLLFVGMSVNAQYTPSNNLNYVKLIKTPPAGTTTDQMLVYDGADQFVKMRPVDTDNREAVNDVNKTIIGTANRLIAYTAITADRTVTLPPATTANQRIWITDESGLCSNARRIIVAPNGSDVIGGDAFSVINFPNGSGYLESNGAGKWNIISTTAVQFSAGVNTLPTITDNGNGSVTLGTGVYSLFANANGVGRPKAYQIAGGTFTFVDGSTNYIYADYNTTTGAVTLQQTTTETPLNDLTQTLVYAAYRQGTTLHPRNFDTQGIALSNKINRSIYRTQRVRFEEGGILVGESASPAVRTITISSGTVWVAATEQTLIALTSAANTCYHVIQTSPGVWTTTTVVTQYNNTQYNTSSGLQTLNNNEYGVNWLYRSIGTDNDMAIILGGASYTLGQAQSSSKPTNLPPFMRHMELVGRIIVQKNSNTATQIDNVSSTFFTASGVTDHNALNNLQTAQTGVTYGHITDAAQTIAGVKTFSSSPIVPTATTGLQAVNKSYVDSITSSGVSNVSTVGGASVTNALDNLKASIPVNYSKVVYVNATNPNGATIFDLNNPPTVNDNALKADVTNLYIGTDSSGWVYNATSLTYTSNTITSTLSNFYLSGTTTDAGGNKTGAIYRTGKTGFGTSNLTGILNAFTGTSGNTFDLSIQPNGSISMCNAAASFTVPLIIGKSNNSTGLQLISATNNSISGSDMSFDVRENDNTDFSTLTTPAFTFSRFTSTLFSILRNGKSEITSNSSGALVDVLTVTNPNMAANTETSIFFAPTNATGGTRGARITASNDGSNNVPLRFYTGAGASITEKMRIGSLGGVSIGNTIDNGAGTLNVTSNVTTIAGTTANHAVIKSQLDLKSDIASPTFTGDPKAPTATAGDNDTSIATTAFVFNNARPYKVYVALLTQSGTSAPTATVLENTLGGTVVYSYDAVGQYRGTLTGAFPTAKTFFTHGGGAATLNTQIRTNANTNYFTIITNTGSTAADTVLQNTCVEIRVYP